MKKEIKNDKNSKRFTDTHVVEMISAEKKQVMRKNGTREMRGKKDDRLSERG